MPEDVVCIFSKIMGCIDCILSNNSVSFRVLQYGTKDDWYEMLNLYGGKKKVADIVRQIKNIPIRDACYAAIVLEVDKKELSCFTPRV